MKGLKGKNVLVTGATSGIGQAIAAHFATEGANVALNYRNDPDKLEDTKPEFGLSRLRQKPVKAKTRLFGLMAVSNQST